MIIMNPNNSIICGYYIFNLSNYLFLVVMLIKKKRKRFQEKINYIIDHVNYWVQKNECD